MSKIAADICVSGLDNCHALNLLCSCALPKLRWTSRCSMCMRLVHASLGYSLANSLSTGRTRRQLASLLWDWPFPSLERQSNVAAGFGVPGVRYSASRNHQPHIPANVVPCSHQRLHHPSPSPRGTIGTTRPTPSLFFMQGCEHRGAWCNRLRSAADVCSHCL